MVSVKIFDCVCIPVPQVDDVHFSWCVYAPCFDRGRWADVLPSAGVHLNVSRRCQFLVENSSGGAEPLLLNGA